MRFRVGGLTYRTRRTIGAFVLDDVSLVAALQMPAGEIPWSGVLVVEGVETGDERIIESGALTWDELPLPLTDNHDEDRVIGRIDTITRVGDTIQGTGVFDDSDAGREAARHVAARLRRGLSVDLDDVEGEIVIEMPTDEEGGPMDDEDDVMVIPVGGDLFRLTRARIRGAALCTIAAFVEAQITLDETPEVQTEPEMPAEVAASASCECQHSTSVVDRTPLVASAARFPVAPPAAWFDDPEFGRGEADPRLVLQPEGMWACPLTDTDEGQVFGHIGGPGCHIGYTDRCVTMASATSRDFGEFNSGACRTAEGTDVLVGQITLSGGHADIRLSAEEAAKHYDDTDSAVADVHVGWDVVNNIGWFAGAYRPDVTEEQRRVLRAHGVSGDWRPIRGSSVPELVAILSVPVQGFGIRRSYARVASGMVVALVASAVAQRDPALEFRHGVEQRLMRLERALNPLNPLIAAAIRAEVHAST